VQAVKEFLIQNVVRLRGASADHNRLLWALVESPDSVDEMLRENRQRGFNLRDHYSEIYEKEVIPEIKSK
jgi:hypothetical protein